LPLKITLKNSRELPDNGKYTVEETVKAGLTANMKRDLYLFCL